MVLSPSSEVKVTANDDPCSGFFDEDEKCIVVACAKPVVEWVSVLVHESCHLDQYLDQNDKWNECIRGYEDLWGWLEGSTQLNSAQVRKMLDRVMFIEWDCERRSIEKIRKLNLPINISDYARKANSYLYAYEVMNKHRAFPTGIYYDPEVTKHAPSYLLRDITKTPDAHKIAVNNFYVQLIQKKESRSRKAA